MGWIERLLQIGVHLYAKGLLIKAVLETERYRLMFRRRRIGNLGCAIEHAMRRRSVTIRKRLDCWPPASKIMVLDALRAT
jgi:hypothetical protein